MVVQRQLAAGDGLHGPALDHFCRLLDILPAGACICRADGRLTHYTAQAANLWGRAPELACSDPPRWCGAWRLYGLDGTPMPHDQSWLARALIERVPYHGHRVQIERPDGGRRFALCYASPMIADDGRVLGGLNLLVDVTEQHVGHHARAERERLRDERMVALACDIRAGLDPLRRTAQDLASSHGARRTDGPADMIDRQLRHITRLVDRLLNLEVDAD